MTFTANCIIVSHNPAGNYSQLDNSPVRDRNLSVEAKAVLWYLASNSDKWHLVMQNVADVMNMGINRTRRAIAELRERGLVQGENLRNEAGKYIGWAYKIILPAEFRDRPPETGQLEDSPSARVSSTRASSTPIQMPIIKLNSDLKKKNKQNILPSITPNDNTHDNTHDNTSAEDEEADRLIFSFSGQKNEQLEPFRADLYLAFIAPEVISTAPVSGIGKSSAADYTYTTDNNQTTKSELDVELTSVQKPPVQKLTYADRRSARQKATLETQGKEKGLWQSMAELNAFIDALTAHTEENHRIHSPKSWVHSELRKAVDDGVSLNWNEFKSTGKVSQANKRPVPSSATSTPLYTPSQAQEFGAWYDWAKKYGLVDYSYSDHEHFAMVVMLDGLTLPWREAKARFPQC
jgi:hypothetical protein